MSKTSNPVREILLGDPALAARTLLIVDRLKPAMNAAVEHAREQYPTSLAKQAMFANGAIYGIVAHWLRDSADDEVTMDQINRVTAVVAQFLELLYSPEFDGDWDLLGRRLVPGAFAEVGAT